MAPSLEPGHLRRYRRLAMLLVRHGRGGLVRSAGMDDILGPEEELEDESSSDGPAHLAAELEAMGPTFVKLGQLLSSRVDLVEPAYVEALARLQDRVEPFGIDEVEQIVADELGVRLSRVFPTFDREPLAAASLGQVHRATLRDGREVVVKVQRPGIRAEVRQDLEVLEELATLLDDHTDAGRRFGFGDLLDQFRRSLLEELDYRREADNLEEIGDALASYDRLLVPRPHRDLSTDRVLTMDFVPGRKVTEVGPLGLLELDGAPLADDLFRSYLEQVLVRGVFHADPHPGNVLLTDDHRLALLDVGMVARLTPSTRERLVKLFLALADGSPEEVTRVATTLGEPLPDFDETALARAVAEVVERTGSARAADLDVGAMVLRLTTDAARAGLRMQPELAMLGKALLNLDLVATTLDPHFQPREALQRHTAELMRSQMRTSPAALMASVLEAKEFVEQLPGRVNRAFDAVGEGRFELRVKAFDEDEFLFGLHKLANVLASAVVLAAMILGAALLARPTSDGTTPANRIALVVFVVAVLVALGMLVRIMVTTRRSRRRRLR